MRDRVVADCGLCLELFRYWPATLTFDRSVQCARGRRRSNALPQK